MSEKTKIGDPEWVYGTLLRRGWLEYRCTIVRALVQSWEETDLEEGKARKPIKRRRKACVITPFSGPVTFRAPAGARLLTERGRYGTGAEVNSVIRVCGPL